MGASRKEDAGVDSFVCGGCGLACVKTHDCAQSFAWQREHGTPQNDKLIRPPAASRLLSRAARAAIVVGPGVPGNELVDWMLVAERYHTLWLWDQGSLEEQAWAIEGGQRAHLDWIGEEARTVVLWGLDVHRYPPWPGRFAMARKTVITPPATSGHPAWQWILEQWERQDRPFGDETALVVDPLAVDPVTLHLLFRWSNQTTGPRIVLLNPDPHRLGAHRLIADYSGSIVPGLAEPQESGRIAYGLSVDRLQEWGCDLVIWVQGSGGVSLPSGLSVPVITASAEPAEKAAYWIPMRWTRGQGKWSLADDGMMVDWHNSTRDRSVAREWFLD